MRILVLSFYYEPDLCAGSFRTTAFVNELQKQLSPGDVVEVITTMPNRYKSFSQSAPQNEQNGNVHITRIPLGTHKSGFMDQSKLFVKYAYAVWKELQKRQRYDKVFATSSRLMTAFLGALAAKHQKVPLYLDIRDIFPDTLQSLFAKSKLRFAVPVFQWIEKYTVNAANHINLVSRGFERYFTAINGTVPYSFYSNGIDDIFMNVDFTKTEATGKTVLTYAGNIGEGQGLEKIIPRLAGALGEEYEIRIIGDGGRKERLSEKVREYENVKMFPPVDRETLLEHYRQSDILFLHLNDYEAFKKVLPSKLFEYAVTNKYIIAGVNGYAKDFVKEWIAGAMLFTPCDIDSFKSAFDETAVQAPIDRTEFKHRFSRAHIMEQMAKEVYEL